jgi:transcriptional regulator with XRE-family HTH domain
MNDEFKDLFNDVPEETERLIHLSMGIAARVSDILSDQKKDQKYLADQLGKSQSEISKWLSGSHNFTIKSIAKIEKVLHQNILFTHFDVIDHTFIASTQLYSYEDEKWMESKVEMGSEMATIATIASLEEIKSSHLSVDPQQDIIAV